MFPILPPQAIARTRLFICVSAVVVLLVPAFASAQWAEQGVAVSTTLPGDQFDPVAVPDGAGGMYVAYIDYRTGSNLVHVQRFDGSGRRLWGDEGVIASTLGTSQNEPALVSDAQGGVIVSIYTGDLVAQRLDADGSRLWGDTGVTVSSAPFAQRQAVMAADGAGGVFIAWQDYRGGTSRSDIYAQHLDENGAASWLTDGVTVVSEEDSERFISVVPDDDGGIYVSYEDVRVGQSQTWLQRVDNTGTVAWIAGGINLPAVLEFAAHVRLLGDGLGNVYATWHQYTASAYDIRLQKVGPTGAPFWSAGGIAVCGAAQSQIEPVLAPDDVGGLYVAWRDARNSYYDVYAQRLDADGTPYWTADGISVAGGSFNQAQVQLSRDGAGGAVLAWEDSRDSAILVYAQILAADGSKRLANDGTAVAPSFHDQRDPFVVADGAGGLLAAWEDARAGTHVYAQRIERHGYWGFPSPLITSTRDIPGDQGGQVFLAWDASRLDPWPEFGITNYTVWRAIDAKMAAAMPSKQIRFDKAGGRMFYWHLVADISAAYLPGYSLPAATLFDSTSVTAEYNYFQVMAHTADPQVFWASPPDSGRSVDNLAPAAPQQLAAEVVAGPLGIELTWAPNTEPDILHYQVFRGLSPDFVADQSTLVGTTSTPSLTDGSWDWSNTWYYRVRAVDVHENAGPTALLEPVSVTAVPVPARFSLAQNRPNPFNPATVIAFGLPRSATTSVTIYDVGGRLVRRLVDAENLPAGSHQRTWRGDDAAGRPVGAGVYLYRIQAGEFEAMRRMTLVK